MSVDREDTVYINDRPVNVQLLTERLKTEIERRGIAFVFLRADQDVPYGRIMMVMDQIKLAGADRIGMVTVPIEKRAGPRK